MDTPLPPNTPNEVTSRIGHYVYLYIDPRSGKPFYVGKGKGQGVLAHLSEEAKHPSTTSRIFSTLSAKKSRGPTTLATVCW
jgi:hypothetical protein